MKKILVGTIVATGALAILRLALIGGGFWEDSQPESMEAFREKMNQASQFERDQTERLWKESGKPLPPGGMDELWRRAHGQSPHSDGAESDADVLKKERESNQYR